MLNWLKDWFVALVGAAALSLIVGCAGKGGSAAIEQPPKDRTDLSDCGTVGSISNTGTLIIEQTCIDGNGNSVAICKSDATGEQVPCSSSGSSSTTINPAPTPAPVA